MASSKQKSKGLLLRQALNNNFVAAMVAVSVALLGVFVVLRSQAAVVIACSSSRPMRASVKT